jgi:hypothetical protein
MDYGHILKRSWKVTWNHKILWLFGFFIMSGGANYSTSSWNMGGDTSGYSPEQWEAMVYAQEWFLQWLPLIIGVAFLALIIGIAWFAVSIAANGGLVHLVNEAEEGRAVRAGLGWRAGFRNWWRVFAILVLLFLPVIILGIMAFLVVVFTAVAAGGGEEAIFAILTSLCCVMIVAIIVGLILAFIITILGTLGIRHAVLDDLGPIDALKQAWNDLRTRFKDVFLMWLITIGIGIGYGLAVGMIALGFGVGMFVAFLAGALWAAAGIGFLLFLALLIPNAIYSTYISSVWTLFFRQMTGRDTVAARPAYRPPPAVQPTGAGAPGYPPPPPSQTPPSQAPSGYPPPAPRTEPAPPRPPAAPQPPSEPPTRS